MLWQRVNCDTFLSLSQTLLIFPNAFHRFGNKWYAQSKRRFEGLAWNIVLVLFPEQIRWRDINFRNFQQVRAKIIWKRDIFDWIIMHSNCIFAKCPLSFFHQKTYGKPKVRKLKSCENDFKTFQVFYQLLPLDKSSLENFSNAKLRHGKRRVKTFVNLFSYIIQEYIFFNNSICLEWLN